MIESKNLSDQQLLKYADEHIQYEYDMLLWSARVLAFLSKDSSNGPISWVIRNALLNTFAIHARNLLEFLFPPDISRRQPSDITIEDYINKDLLERERPSIPKELQRVRNKANKQVAHLTTDRITFEKSGKEWNFIDIVREIKGIFSKLVIHIQDEKISSCLKNSILEKEFGSPYINWKVLNDQNQIPVGVEIKITSKAITNK